MKTPIKLGCDPELFMRDVTGKLRASCDLIGGSKEFPMALPFLGDGYAVQEDNVAIEFNIPPADSVKQFVESVGKIMQFLTTAVQKDHGFEIVNLSAASFPADELVHPKAQEFGCDPDFNAWTLRKNPRPNVADKTLRSAGGHLHIGFEKGKLHIPVLIKCCDLFLGVPSVLMDKAGEKRRPLYGKSGAFRPKAYGAEYRTLGNFWVFKPELVDWVGRNAIRAVEAVEARFQVDDYQDMIRDAIDNNNSKAAQFLCDELKLEVLSV